MVTGKTTPRPERVAYKTYLSLLPVEWAKLKAEAQKRGISGHEVIEAALSAYCGKLAAPEVRPLEPVPEPND